MKELKSEILTVRLTPSERRDLQKIAEICRDEETTTARKAIQEIIAYAKRHDWQMSFPIIFEQLPAQHLPHSAVTPKPVGKRLAA